MSEDAPVNTGAVAWPDDFTASVMVRRMQTKLHRWATEDPGRRFGDLFNLVYDPAFLVHAWERVSTNKGARTAGIDKATAAVIETWIGVGAFLGQIRDSLKTGEFRPVEVRRVMVPKGNPEKDGLCKLTSVVSKLAGHQTARAVIEAMIGGERDPRALAALGKGNMRGEKLPALAAALTGMRFGPEHAGVAASLLAAIDLLEEELRSAEDAVAAKLAAIPASWGVDADGATGPDAGREEGAPVLPAVDRLDEIPGLGRESAAALIAEIGLDMSRFPTPQALVSWAGLTPTARQSGPRKGRGKKGRGNTYAKHIAVLAAYAAANTDTFLGERFRRLASRPGGGGRKKAGCAVGRSILVIVWHLLSDPAARYRDLGPDWHARHTDRNRKARSARRQLEALGYDVIITLREDVA